MVVGPEKEVADAIFFRNHSAKATHVELLVVKKGFCAEKVRKNVQPKGTFL